MSCITLEDVVQEKDPTSPFTCLNVRCQHTSLVNPHTAPVIQNPQLVCKCTLSAQNTLLCMYVRLKIPLEGTGIHVNFKKRVVVVTLISPRHQFFKYEVKHLIVPLTSPLVSHDCLRMYPFVSMNFNRLGENWVKTSAQHLVLTVCQPLDIFPRVGPPSLLQRTTLR